MQIIEEREYTLKIQRIRVSDDTIVTVVRGVSSSGVPTDGCPEHPATVDCSHLQEATNFLHRMGF